jgi:hypothetical protein
MAKMFDPIYLFILVFGGALVGLISGLWHKRGFIGVVSNALVAGSFGIASSQLWPHVPERIFDLLLSLGLFGRMIFYLTPIVGGFAGLAVLGAYRRWILRDQPAPIKPGKIALVAVILLCIAALIAI